MRDISYIPDDNTSTCSRYFCPILILLCHFPPATLPPTHPRHLSDSSLSSNKELFPLRTHTHLVPPRSTSTYTAWNHPYLSRLQSVFFIPLLRDSVTFSGGSLSLCSLPGWDISIWMSMYKCGLQQGLDALSHPSGMQACLWVCIPHVGLCILYVHGFVCVCVYMYFIKMQKNVYVFRSDVYEYSLHCMPIISVQWGSTI